MTAALQYETYTAPLLDQSYEMLQDGEVFAAMEQLDLALRDRRAWSTAETWARFSREECLTHPIRDLVHQNPLTRRAFEKPRGYAGDAAMLDLIYGEAALPDETSALGAELYAWEFQTPCARSVRARRDILAGRIDRVAAQTTDARVLSIACGHLREAQQSLAVLEGLVHEFVAFDQDSESLAVVERDQCLSGVTTVQGSVRDLLKRTVAFSDFDLVYAAGLYDYLDRSTAARLTAMLFDMLAPGGELLIANLAPETREAGYMESFMDWRLVYRDEVAMLSLVAGIPKSAMEGVNTFRDAFGSVVFLDVEKS